MTDLHPDIALLQRPDPGDMAASAHLLAAGVVLHHANPKLPELQGDHVGPEDWKRDIEAAGASRSNHWVYPTGEVDAIWDAAPDGDPPGFFVSVASLKDPNHDPGPTRKYAGEMVVWTDWSTVATWAGRPPGERGANCAAFRDAVEDKMFALFEAHFPDLAELVVLREHSTPLATAFRLICVPNPRMARSCSSWDSLSSAPGGPMRL